MKLELLLGSIPLIVGNHTSGNNSTLRFPKHAQRKLSSISLPCTDNPVGWHDSGGSIYNCHWYSVGSNCEDFGNGYENYGKTANEACCVCGGGLTPPTRAPTKAPTRTPTRAPTRTPTRVPTKTPTRAPTRVQDPNWLNCGNTEYCYITRQKCNLYPDGTGYCTCLPGWKDNDNNCGDDLNECKELDAFPCSSGSGGHCIDKSPSDGRYECTCEIDYGGFNDYGNGPTKCIRKGSCFFHPGSCHANADCLLSEDDQQYYCTCKVGFYHDGTSCTPVVPFQIIPNRPKTPSSPYRPQITVDNVRFNKFGILDKNFRNLPLIPDSYPISNVEAVAQFLKYGTDAESVVNHQKDNEIIYDVEELINIVGGPPDHPSRNFDDPYWKKFDRVIDIRNIKGSEMASRALSRRMQLPLRWKHFTVDDVAEAVYDEYPGSHQADFLEDLVRGEYGPIEYTEVIPRRANARFLRGIIALADINTWSVGFVGPHNFGAKWYIGRARPEEVAWLIHEGIIDAPADIIRKIHRIMNFNQATDFTRYNREDRPGSPRHPSWPAMHSAGSNMSFWIGILLKLTPRQLCEAKKVDFAVSFARTVAGVHFEDDNLAGLNIGQEIVARALPSYLAEKYDSDLAVCNALVNQRRFDWADYDPLQDCDSL